MSSPLSGELSAQSSSVLATTIPSSQPNMNMCVSSTTIAQQILIKGTGVNAQNAFGYTELYWLCTKGKGNIKYARQLLERGADPNCRSFYRGRSSLHEACYVGSLELALLLIRFGGDVYLKSGYGKTPLDFCSMGLEVIDRQVVEKAYIHQQNWHRRAAFATFLTSVYGSADFQARQQKQQLLPLELRKDEDENGKEKEVQSTNVQEWKVITKVLCVPELCRLIAAYL